VSQEESDILDYDVPSPEILPSTFLVSRRGKIPSLIGKETTEIIQIKKKENYKIEFSNVIFIDHVSVYTGDNAKKSDLQIVLTDILGKTKIADSYKESETDRTIYNFKCFTNNLSVKNINIIQSEPIKALKIYYHSLENLSKISEVYTDFWSEYDTVSEEIKSQKRQLRLKLKS